MTGGKYFDETIANVLEEVIIHRRDIRGDLFTHREIPDVVIERILFAGLNGPSVGFSQPWEFVVIRDKQIQRQIKKVFEESNQTARHAFEGQRGDLYDTLRLEGIIESSVNIAVYYKPNKKPVLGQNTMREMGEYSVVCAVQNMWLMSRAMNIGMGWVSIIDPQRVNQILEVPLENKLVAYLCLGYVAHFPERPQLEALNWERRKDKNAVVSYGKYGHHSL